jgi:beta-xylosidase
MKLLIFILLVTYINCPLAGQNRQYTNPVSDTIYIADPYILNFDETYYLYGTSANDGFKFWISSDLVNWKAGGYIFQKDANSWGKKNFWAPEVIHYQNKFYLIYSSEGKTMFGNGLRLCLAVSDLPTGPFKDLYAPWFDFGFSCIDGHIFVDDDGKPYLFYEKVGSVGKPFTPEGYLWGMIFGVQLAEDLSHQVGGEPKLCIYPDQPWENPKSNDARSTEGMTVFKHNGTYYMTYSGNHYADPQYGVGYATAKSPLGKWTKSESNPVLKNDIPRKVSGPGHNCIIKSPDNTEWFIVYHSHANISKPSGKRILNIDRILFQPDGSIVVKGPTRTPQQLPSGSK